MNKAAREARAAYMRQWRRKNPDKERKYKESYWTKKAQQAEQDAAEQELEDDSNQKNSVNE